MARFVALLVLAAVCFAAANAQTREEYRRAAQEEEAFELAEFIQEVEKFSNNPRQGRQITEILGSAADIGQILGLVFRLAQATVSAVQYVFQLASAAARQNNNMWTEFLNTVVQYGSVGAVFLARAYSNDLADTVEGFLDELRLFD